MNKTRFMLIQTQAVATGGGFEDVAGAFGFSYGPYYFAANSHVFGHKTSASTWEPPRRAIEALSEHNYSRPELIEKHKDLLDAVKWAEPPPAGCTFTQAKACANNQGVLDPTGAPRPSPHHIYVDDNLMAAISRFMK